MLIGLGLLISPVKAEQHSWQQLSAAGYTAINSSQFELAQRCYEQALSSAKNQGAEKAELCDLQLDVVTTLLLQRQYQSALNMLLEHAADVKVASANCPLLQVRYLDRLSEAYLRLDELTRSISAAESSLALQERLLPADCRQILEKRFEIFALHAYKHDYKKALVLAQQLSIQAQHSAEPLARRWLEAKMRNFARSHTKMIQAGLKGAQTDSQTRDTLAFACTIDETDNQLHQLRTRLECADLKEAQTCLGRITKDSSAKEIDEALKKTDNALRILTTGSSSGERSEEGLQLVDKARTLAFDAYGRNSYRYVVYSAFEAMMLSDRGQYRRAINIVDAVDSAVLASCRADVPTSHARLNIARACLKAGDRAAAQKELLKQEAILTRLHVSNETLEEWKRNERMYGLNR